MTDSKILRLIGLRHLLMPKNLLGKIVLKAMAQARADERDRCAKILNDRAKLCAEAADQSDDEQERIDLRATAWDFSVIEQQIIDGEECAP